MGSTAKRSPHWLLDVKDGNFSIRESTIDGPAFDKPGYEGLIHFASTHAAGESKAAETLAGEIRNSFLCTSKVALSGDLVSRNLIVENSVLAANGRVFDLRVPIAAANVSLIDLTSCTLAAGEEYFHFEMLPGSGAAGKPAPSVRIVADETVFGPPVQSDGKSEEKKPLLISGVPPESIASVVEWWEYACAYSNLIGLPNAGGSRSRREPLAEWKQIAGAVTHRAAVGRAQRGLASPRSAGCQRTGSGRFSSQERGRGGNLVRHGIAHRGDSRREESGADRGKSAAQVEIVRRSQSRFWGKGSVEIAAVRYLTRRHAATVT